MAHRKAAVAQVSDLVRYSHSYFSFLYSCCRRVPHGWRVIRPSNLSQHTSCLALHGVPKQMWLSEASRGGLMPKEGLSDPEQWRDHSLGIWPMVCNTPFLSHHHHHHHSHIHIFIPLLPRSVSPPRGPHLQSRMRKGGQSLPSRALPCQAPGPTSVGLATEPLSAGRWESSLIPLTDVASGIPEG